MLLRNQGRLDLFNFLQTDLLFNLTLLKTLSLLPTERGYIYNLRKVHNTILTKLWENIFTKINAYYKNELRDKLLVKNLAEKVNSNACIHLRFNVFFLLMQTIQFNHY